MQMKKLKRLGQRLFVGAIGGAVAIGAIAHSTPAEAARLRPCPWALIQCLDVWDPVICPNGQVYSNACYARRACQTDCVPY